MHIRDKKRLISLTRGSIYKLKRMGPSTEPCGTPQGNEADFDIKDPTNTERLLPERYPYVTLM